MSVRRFIIYVEEKDIYVEMINITQYVARWNRTRTIQDLEIHSMHIYLYIFNITNSSKVHCISTNYKKPSQYEGIIIRRPLTCLWFFL